MDTGTRSCGTFVPDVIKEIFARLPPDVLAEILTRVPPNNRRWLRLVCQHWRHVVDTHKATNLQNRAKTLVITKDMAAYVFDDLSMGRPRELWARDRFGTYRDIRMVGTCNGLNCLCDKYGGAIILFNPVTGETLAIPPLPSPYAGGYDQWHRTYNFTYHPATGWYKIGHIPRDLDRVLLFTLGEASWQDVPIVGGGERCDLDVGIMSVDGYMYFAIGDTKARILSFELNNKNFTFVRPPPNILSRRGCWSLTEVHGRLGITYT
jgi:hypothetical protein